MPSSQFMYPMLIAVSYTHLDVYKRQLVYSAKIIVQLLVITGNCDHCSIIRSKAELRDIDIPTIFPGMFAE